jgi:hypothetical protein
LHLRRSRRRWWNNGGSLRWVAWSGQVVRPCASNIAARLHLRETGWRRRRRSHINARDDHQRPTRAELHTRARLNLDGFANASAIYKSAEARIGINEQAAPVLETKLGVAARDHRPLRLIENDMTLRRIAPDLDGRMLVSVLRLRLSGALFYENDFHNGNLKNSYEF